jgi:hypothetical protein
VTETLLRPEPATTRGAQPLDADASPRWAAQRLLDGERLLLTGRYATGVGILRQIEAQLPPPGPMADHRAKRAWQRRFRWAASGLLAPVEAGAIALEGARPVGFLGELYPELDRFHLPFVQLQELHGAWQRYRDGLHLPVLGRALHPFYGTYAPTRTEHLELFATWLKGWQGPRTRAADVGTGCGVLAFLLTRAGFAQVEATDCSPNAVESVRRELERWPQPIQPLLGDLLEPVEGPIDLVVFNPPWMQGPVEGHLDRALYFEPGLFERFFEQALERLSPQGRVVMVFSTIIQLVQPELPHPVEAELARGRLVLVDKLRRRIRPPKGQRRTKERVEIWELGRA